MKIIPIPLTHDANEPCGYYIANRAKETIAFISDTGTLESVSLEADCYMLEANYDEQGLQERLQSGDIYEGLHARLTSEFGHMSIQQVKAWLKANAAQDSHIIILRKGVEEADRITGYKNIVYPDNKGRLEYQFGVNDLCPF